MRPSESGKPCSGVAALVNCLVATLNIIYGSAEPADSSRQPPSATQRRVLQRLSSESAHFLASSGAVAQEDDMREYLQSTEGYSRSQRAVPLGDDGGVPDVAATVPLASIRSSSACLHFKPL